ncbi:HNH/ENDO VII family nuclease [Bacillus toyonensis]|uniref:HNH/ENDO VII family nuclease n=1 Tax=Bacillus toyonensis TaxID=155322 RepID=UPI002E1BA5F8|nr:HNH/ENDO VII family nuclease [Bacillus toyonensis]
MRKFIIIILSVVLLSSTYAPSLSFAIESVNKSGWVMEQNRWYYYEASGTKKTGWKEIDGKWYYLDTLGAMQIGWKEIDGKWYYLDTLGAMQISWKEINGKWYYLDTLGAMQVGWKEINGKWYYLDTSGVMQTNTIKRKHFELHFNNNGYIENLKATMSSNFYSEPSFNSKKTGIIQSGLYSIKNMIVDNWIEIQINQTSGWIYLDGNPSDSSEISYNEFVVQAPTALYDEASFSKKNKDILYPRTVIVTEEKGNGWKKIKTQNGEKWVAPEGQKYNLQSNVKMYLKPSMEEKSTGVLSAQMVTLLDEKTDGWKKVLTDNGTRWIAPEGINYKVANGQTLYSTPDFKSTSVGSIAPQTVRVVDFQENGWLKIKTNMGDTWIAPNGVTYDLKQNVAMYRRPSFLADKEEYGLIPQNVILLENRADGWKRIKTAYGDRWIVPDGVPYQISKTTQLYKDLQFTTLEGSIISEKVTVIGEQPGGWYQINSSKGTHWIAPNGIKYRTTKDINYSASKDILSPNLGVIPKDTFINVVDNDKILWNGQYVYGFLTYFSMELVEKTDRKYIEQPSIYASLPQIKNVATNGHDDGISDQIFKNLSNWTFDKQNLNIPDINIPDMSIPDLNINININMDFTDFNKAMKELEQTTKELQTNNANIEKTMKEMNDAIRLANEGMQQMKQGVNQANSGIKGMNEAINQANSGMEQMKQAVNQANLAMKGMNEGINQANKGMQQMIQGVNQANSGLRGMNDAVDQANVGMQQMLNATNKMQKGLEKTISGVDVSVKKINSIIDAPNKRIQSDLKTIHLDFDFSNIVPTSSPEEKLRQQQRDEAMSNILAFMPVTGNFVSLAELLSGKNLNSDADLQASDYALNMLAVLGGGEIKAGAAFLGSISKVTKRQKFTNTKIDLSWLDKFGDKYAAHEVTGTVKVAGQTKDISRRVYRMKNIDWDYVAPPSVNKSGKSNLQLALDGGVPFTKDNHKIELHHVTQKEPGAMVEIPANKHDEFTKALHGLVESGESFRNDKELYKQYNNFRNNYWKMRAREHLEGK